jgi:hypothetical protein
MFIVQTFNFVGQSPCAVIAYMMGSCNGGSEFFNCLHVLELRSYLICRILTVSTATWIHILWPHCPRGPDNSNLCECSTVGYSLFSLCVACQGEIWITCGYFVSSFQSSQQKTYCESHCNWLAGFPNPVPSGIRVPQWALIDVTVRC